MSIVYMDQSITFLYEKIKIFDSNFIGFVNLKPWTNINPSHENTYKSKPFEQFFTFHSSTKKYGMLLLVVYTYVYTTYFHMPGIVNK